MNPALQACKRFFSSETKPLIPMGIVLLCQIAIAFFFLPEINQGKETHIFLYYLLVNGLTLLCGVCAYLHGHWNNDYDTKVLATAIPVYALVTIFVNFPSVHQILSDQGEAIVLAGLIGVLHLCLIDVLIKEIDLLKCTWAWIGTIVYITLIILGHMLSLSYLLFGVYFCFNLFGLLLTFKNLIFDKYEIYSIVSFLFFVFWLFIEVISTFFDPTIFWIAEPAESLLFSAMLLAAVRLNNGKLPEKE